MQFWALMVDSLRESLDRKIFWVLVLITLVVVLTMASVGFEGDNVSFFFGLWDSQTEHYNPLSDLGRSHLVGFVVYFLLSAIVGWIGVVLMIIATAGAFPAFMEGGAIDVVLSKPVSRGRLFLYRYIGGMVFVLLQAALFVVLTFLVMGLRWGVWEPGYLLAVPLLVLLFSYVYCVSVLVAVKTRSTVAAILLSIGAWIAFAVIHQAPGIFDVFPALREHERLHAAIRVISWIPPKTGDFDYLAARWARAGTSVEVLPAAVMTSYDDDERDQMERAHELEEKELAKNPLLSIGSSLAFEVVIVSLAMWSFTRRDF